MKFLLAKEFSLAIHPTNILFMFLSAMMLIPNYPYYVIFFYTSLGIFFICLTGRENHDIFYSMLLPVRKREIVKARIWLAVILEAAQLIFCLPFAVIRGTFNMQGNEVGMDANIAFFGISLIIIGIFNFAFFRRYYSSPDKTGKAFVWASIIEFICITIFETCAHVIPFFKNELDTPDPENLTQKLIVLSGGIIIFMALTISAYKISVKAFEKLDL
ncbi:hypothetical protein SDC9_139328 [bioreactor metagenome]|uniref:ABC-2 transporter permease n=1 Tax=bioreactor metagenome TaxID=1076179 RepID=A0A645DUC3_9ZZZZ|nr:ABC-2 transporter permease [Oscillospiraceae bacterium]